MRPDSCFLRSCKTPRIFTVLHAAGLTLAALPFLLPIAHAETGIDVGASSSREEFNYPNGYRIITAQRVTLTPWWKNDDWRLSASLPLILREEEYSGTFQVWRIVNRRLVQVPVTLTGNESDSGLGDASLRATRTWSLSENFSTYSTAYVKLANGDDQAGTLSVAAAQTRTTRQGSYALGSGTTDVGLMQGLNFSSEWVWAAVEGGFIASNGGSVPQDDRPVAYAGLGVTPVSFLELSVAFDYEGEVATGSGTLQQVTYSVSLMPVKHLTITASTYDDNSGAMPDSNWSLGVGVNW